ncbi:endonuclease/exonuclease/phosphatase [Phormidesmis priestleyi ULC007]|uniref:Endonuclease/exonuclease/phosphatase n=1 Tax=Phormidesmis priestleyi ULC007 TaxID=1920490 RepID=A0A2T1DM27_9CYAN|nr:esterase-like activity of phytase family protein [Phormidesmis priestleyi]PSB21526.1 endonuclease/exonuclease/phosphatase [Phormidesmis priestleyi ULC007]PZO54566.1 MAG: esterase-like activity of phytase family protein [Phormidesmis priestleyi]
MKHHVFSWVLRLITIALLTLLTACNLPQVSAEDRLFLPLSLEFSGAYTLPKTTVKETLVGGLSGLTYDRKQNLFYAVSDDRSDRAPARFYTLKLELDSTHSTIAEVVVKDVTILKQEDGQPFGKNTIDPEGIALSSRDSVFISSEGVIHDGVLPFIGEFDLKTGQLRRKLPIPEAFLPDPDHPLQPRGVQDNLAFESLTLNAQAASMKGSEPFRLFTATESSLAQDQDLSDLKQGAKNRFLHYLIENDRATLISEHLYQLDPKPAYAFDQGLCEMLAIDQAGHFLSLERSFGMQGFQIKIFQAASGGATDISTIESLRGSKSIAPIRKRLVMDLNDLDLSLDNLEGMTLGPLFPDGSQSLVIVSDDNFNNLTQVTQFLLFKLNGKR